MQTTFLSIRFAAAVSAPVTVAESVIAAISPVDPLGFFAPSMTARVQDVGGAQAVMRVDVDPLQHRYSAACAVQGAAGAFTSELRARWTSKGYRIEQFTLDNDFVDLKDRRAVEAALLTFAAYLGAGFTLPVPAPQALLLHPARDFTAAALVPQAPQQVVAAP